MKIGIEAQRIFREHKHGMDFVALEMIRRLQKLDQENEYVIFVNEGPDVQCLQETDNFKIEVFGGAYPVWEQLHLNKRAKAAGVDMLHCTSNTAPVFCQLPLIVTIHDIIYFENNPLFAGGYSAYQKFGNLYRRMVVRRLISKAEMILTVSEFERKRMLQLPGINPETLRVVYNGVGSHFKKIEDQQLLSKVSSKYNLPEKFLLFLGNTDPKKNTRNTVVAFARYCQNNGRSHYLVIGDLQPSIIKGYLQEAGLEEFFDQIKFTGYINNSDLPAVINLADIFLYPSKRESFGIPILEGMASGTPVITSITSSMPEVASDAAVLVDPENTDEIAKAINLLLTDRNLREKIIADGLQRASHFSWDNTASSALEIYREIYQSANA